MKEIIIVGTSNSGKTTAVHYLSQLGTKSEELYGFDYSKFDIEPCPRKRIYIESLNEDFIASEFTIKNAIHFEQLKEYIENQNHDIFATWIDFSEGWVPYSKDEIKSINRAAEKHNYLFDFSFSNKIIPMNYKIK